MLGYGPTSNLREALLSSAFDFSPSVGMETPLSILQYIEKCFAVIIFAKVDPQLASTSGFIEEKFGLASESIEKIEPFSIGNPNVCVIFVCLRDSTWVTHVVQKYGNRYPGIRLRLASELLLNVAKKKSEQSAGVVSPEIAFHMLYRPPPPRIPVVSFNHRMSIRPNIPSAIPQQTFSLSRVPTVPVIRPRMSPVIRRPTLPSLPSRGPPPVLVPRHIVRQASQTSQPSGNSDILPSTSQQPPLSAPPLHQNQLAFGQNFNSSLGTYGSITSSMPSSASQPNLNFPNQGIFPPFSSNTSYPSSSGGYY